MMIHHHFTQKSTTPPSLSPSLHTPLYNHTPSSRISRIRCNSSSFSTSISKNEINGAKLKTPFTQNDNFAAHSLLSSSSSLHTLYKHTPFSRNSRIRCNSSSISASSSKNEINGAELKTPFAQNDSFAADSLLSSSTNSSPYPGGMGPFTGRDVNVKKPEWLRQKAPQGFKYEEVKETLSRLNLNTVCQEAQCPNIGETWLLPRLYEKIHHDHDVEWESESIPCNLIPNRPKQRNINDCGVFIMKYIDFMLQDYKLDSLVDWPDEVINTFWYKIARELQNGKARPISNERMRKRLESN